MKTLKYFLLSLFAFLSETTGFLKKLPAFFTGYTPTPSLLHGDLWSGNAITDSAGAPAIIDPAVYYGWAEAELAMTNPARPVPYR